MRRSRPGLGLRKAPKQETLLALRGMGMSAESFLYLTTRGRRTGKPRQIEIWFVAHDEAFYLIAELGESAGWVQNIREHAEVEF